MTAMRIAVAQIIQESNFFVPCGTTIENFRTQYLRQGPAVIDELGSARVEIAGMIDVLRQADCEVFPILSTHGFCGGPLSRACFEELMEILLAPLRTVSVPIDAVCLALHGAMSVADNPDAESEIVARLQAVLPPNTPIGISLDLHAHVTPEMLRPNVFYVGYREYPHIDMYETGERVASLMLDVLRGRRKPVMALSKRPMIISPVDGRTTDGPLSEVVQAARDLEEGTVLHCSIFPVQPWLDVADMGFAALVCADGDLVAAQGAADVLADMAFARRDALLPKLTSLEDAISTGLGASGLTVVGDCGDAPSGGAAGDNVSVLRALLKSGADRGERLTYVTLVDAPAAALASAAGIGATLTLALGHSVSVNDGKPLTVTALVRTLSDGEYMLSDKGMQGTVVQMGLSAVLSIGSVRVAVRSIGGFEWEPGLFTSVGLDLGRAALMFVKSPTGFRAAYTSITDRILIADTPGPTAANMLRVPFTNVGRPIHPLDSV
jgi:microcystin degradation protein MlrC